MGETAEDTRQETDVQRIARLDKEYERNRAALSEEDRDWLDSVVGMFGGDMQLDVTAQRHEDL